MSDPRFVKFLESAARCPAQPLPRVRGERRRAGIRYQNRVKAALEATINRQFHGAATVESEPWFRFYDAAGPGQIVPDFILDLRLATPERRLIVVEVKYTYVPSAPAKLQRLYQPVVTKALGAPVGALIICKNLIPGAMPTILNLSSVLAAPLASVSTLQWRDDGPIPW